MWKNNQEVTVTGYSKHKCTVHKCENENHRILATHQRNRFKEAKEKLPEGYYLVGEGMMDLSRA